MSALYKICGLAITSIFMIVNGCASFTSFGMMGRSAEEAVGDPNNRYQVEMSNMVGRPTVFAGQITENMTVQDALEKSGATRRYRNMDVAVLRAVEESGQPLRMVVNYHPAKRQVSPEQNYAVLPGDRITVEPASGFRDAFGGKK